MIDIRLHHPLSGFDLDVSLQAGPGITALYGPSGSGKTTLVNAVAGLLRPRAGRISAGSDLLFDAATGVDQPPHRRNIGYVFQEPRLFPHLNVRANLNYGAKRAHKAAAGPAFDDVVDMLGIAPLLARPTGALSGGERARVSIGRALLSKPRLLLMDEPLAALDPARRAEILPFLERLRDAGLPVIYVSHALPEVTRLADTIALIDTGKLVAAGPAHHILSDPTLAQRLGGAQAGAVLRVTHGGVDDDGLTRLHLGGQSLFLPQSSPDMGHDLRIRIQASDVILSRNRPEGLSALNILTATVTQVQPGDAGRVFVQLTLPQGQILLARITARSAAILQLRSGTPCHAIVKAVAMDRADLSRS
ncbi:molybdenum ABC transporter ATP-binding protein [Thioclava sp. SK-1]|uniref:molybdenum ABC transporter ATP-binding protein n=1 Tax=Thioclava sp. SK-1 TaxID=1889770 RepID=UPI000826A49F|nr:molybdenum ABC transporter ATP-binding protein [Thioclava sp. SK-1]OCX66774.1 molybdenum ABC transporter ATP-binding protein [Thioclava sp. SK-1]